MQPTALGKKNTYLLPLILVTSLFFLWAFLHNTNGILIPHLKKALQLSDTKSSFIDIAVYFGYFSIAIPAGYVMHKYGYKQGIILGLFLFACGALLFIPAASAGSFALFLAALYIQAAGATFLETVANPYITILGPKETSERRLNFAQSFNGVGAVVAPIIGGTFILSGVEYSQEQLNAMVPDQLSAYLHSEASTVKIPYLIIACVVLLVAVLFIFSKLPAVKESADADTHTGFSLKVLRHSHVRWAVIAQFFYVGAQVGLASFFIRFSKQVMELPEKDAAYRWGYIAMVGFMVGRFFGTFLMKYIKPHRLLLLFSLFNILLLIIALNTSGNMAVITVMATPFFESIMFPTIFALGIKELGEETKMASSLLVMSIVGGALAPLLMGAISDSTGSMQKAYIIPLLCFVVVAWYGWKGYKIKKVIHVPS
ncbi:MAG: L-fucose:H+ symporter permease [Sphingobacteriales bacterium UTBCD1]|jgi:FHS family L-fucose permease-like MFS transporter|nr:MAG: L-fucose:H+ symporter permease [Sphingobacteriales bacterium UTBCD1]